MSTDVLSVSPRASLAQMASLMKSHCYSCLAVVDNEKPLGIVTERDMLHELSQLLSDSGRAQRAAVDVMSSRLISLQENRSLFDAAGILRGMVTYTDITNLHRSLLEVQQVSDERSDAERIRQLEVANRKLRELSMEDPLLGIGNRRAMEVDLRATHEISRRYGEPYAVAMIDIDNFKYYNDYYGHQQGDKALQQVAETIRLTIRGSDRLYRYGGEELLVLLPQTSVKGARQTAERILSTLEQEKIPNCQSPFRVVTVSCGVSLFSGDPLPLDIEYPQVIARADEALYTAKNNGRNKVVIDPVLECGGSLRGV